MARCTSRWAGHQAGGAARPRRVILISAWHRRGSRRLALETDGASRLSGVDRSGWAIDEAR
jgi:hypothetical protein